MSNQENLKMELDEQNSKTDQQTNPSNKLFTLKKFNSVATWTYRNLTVDTCAICRMVIMESCLRCQAECKSDVCLIVFGVCGHSFHVHCMSLWVQQTNNCPLCQAQWVIERTCT